MKNIIEYIDIKNIIKRLQDIDKLKIVLFDENQRKLFENIPKPGIGEKNNEKSFLLNSIIQLKIENFSMESFDNFSFIFDGNPLNKRIYELIDPRLKKKIENIPEISNFF